MNSVIKFCLLLFLALESRCSEYEFKQETGSYYKLHKKGLTWPEALKTCEAERGYLAIINNQVELNVVKDIITRIPITDIVSTNPQLTFLGFRNYEPYGKYYKTIRGEPLTNYYNTWMPGEPNNGANYVNNHPPEDCGTIERYTMKLNDYICDAPAAFLCEKDGDSY